MELPIAKLSDEQLRKTRTPELAAHVNALLSAQGKPVVNGMNRKRYEVVLGWYHEEYDNYISQYNEKEKEAMAKKEKEKAEKKPVKKEKKEETPVLKMTDRDALAVLASAVWTEGDGPDVPNLTDEQCQLELHENIGLLAPEDKEVIEAMENGPAVWEYLLQVKRNVLPPEEETKPDTKKGKGKKDEKPAKEPKLKKEKKEKKERTPRAEKFTRIDAVCMILSSEGGTPNDIATKANQLYIEKGGPDNLGGTVQYVKIILSALECLEMITVLDGIYSLK